MNRNASLVRLNAREEREDDARPLQVGLILRLMSYTQAVAGKRNWLFLLVLLRAIQLPALTWVTAAVIKGPISRGDWQGTLWGMAGFGLLALSTQLVMHFRQRYALELGETVVHDLRQKMFAHLQSMPMSFFHRTKLGRVISRMSSDIEDVRVGVQEVLFVSLVQIGNMAVAAAFMLWYDATLFLLVIGLLPVLWTVNHFFHRKMSVALRQMRDSFSRVTATLAESVNGIRVTQSFVRQDVNARLFGDLVSDHSQYNYEVNRAQGQFLPLLDLNNQVFAAALLVAGAWQLLRPGATTDVGDLIGFLLMANMFFSPITTLGNQYNQALTAMAGAERVFRLLDSPPEWHDAESAGELRIDDDAHAEHCGLSVEFRDLTFGYDPQRPVLHNINFKARAGETIALVGHTGSGKTSIINLLAKFYLPNSGQLLIDGTDVREITTPSLRRHVAMVLQQNILFTGTVRDNIRFGRPDASDQEVIDVVSQLDCLDLIADLPDGFDTKIGERGGNLSLGQRQIICFARALLIDPRILILDEATSSIDTLTEARVQAALLKLTVGRTSFIIAHRLSTIRHADQVLVLDQGEIVERGTHQRLLTTGGVYAGLHQRFVQAA